jgi:hypothetical protein
MICCLNGGLFECLSDSPFDAALELGFDLSLASTILQDRINAT